MQSGGGKHFHICGTYRPKGLLDLNKSLNIGTIFSKKIPKRGLGFRMKVNFQHQKISKKWMGMYFKKIP